MHRGLTVDKRASARTGIILLLFIVGVISLVTYLQVEGILKENEVLKEVGTDVESYSVDGEDVAVVFSFSNVSESVSGHFEAEAKRITVENRSAVEYIPVTVDIVDVTLGDGDVTREVVFDGMIKSEESSYCIEVVFVTKTSTYRYQDIIIFGGS